VHLAAAGLGEGEVDGVAEALEDLRDGDAGLGKERVVIAGDEERDLQGELLLAMRCCERSTLNAEGAKERTQRSRSRASGL